MKQGYLFVLFFFFGNGLFAQSNILITNPEAKQVLLGDFDTEDYAPAFPVGDPAWIAEMIATQVSPDSVKAYLETLASFENRNTGADTMSTTTGIGAARRWVYEKFKDYSDFASDRLLVSYLQFDQSICGMGQHRNIFAILPGQGPQYQEVVLVEAHLDSRCADVCDINCLAEGMEDNGSGTALVLELARVMSLYTFNRSIVFLITIGEEQGLLGANAFAEYCYTKGVQLKAVLNNDIIGGIICGQTASPPGCPGLNDIDSINVRIYSKGVFNSKHKQLARFSKLEYQEMLQPFMAVKPVVNIMTPEDRTGRSGDHISFQKKAFASIRYTAANEHGNGDPNGTPGYEDRQHTKDDILGVDTNNDGVLDSFFVDFHYLARNAMLNGNALAMAAAGPVPPENLVVEPVNNGFTVSFDDPNEYGIYRVGVRKYWTNDWDTVYTIYSTQDTIYGPAPDPEEEYAVSVASVDANGVESLFSGEEAVTIATGLREVRFREKGVTLLQNHPNPFDEATVIAVRVDESVAYREAYIAVYNIEGRELARLPIDLQPGLNEVVYGFEHHDYIPGTYAYSLVVDGRTVETRQMVYAY
ncbi:MAG: M28 family peptidase [Lewinellaceae bacterium]|nr:M28 family peptidase [Lewinellaceae bacterium]